MWNKLADGFNSYLRDNSEVTTLKSKLANVSCKCVNCKRARPAITQPPSGNNKDSRNNDLQITGSDKETRTDPKRTSDSNRDVRGINSRRSIESNKGNKYNDLKRSSERDTRGANFKKSTESAKVQRTVYSKSSTESARYRHKASSDVEVQAQVEQISRYVPGTEIVYDKDYNINTEEQERIPNNIKQSNVLLSNHSTRDELLNQIFMKDQNSQTNRNNCCFSLGYQEETSPTVQSSHHASVNEIYRRLSDISPEEQYDCDQIKCSRESSKDESPPPTTVDMPLTIEEHIQTSEDNSSCEHYASVPTQVNTTCEHYASVPTQVKVRSRTRADYMCPFCAVMGMKLFQPPIRVMKDEELETRPEMFSRCEQATEFVQVVDKCSSAASIVNSQIDLIPKDKDNKDTSIDGNFLKRKSKVSFATYNACEIESSMHSESSLIQPARYHEFDLNTYGCSCMNNYINSIRPPIQSILYNTYMN